MGMVCNNNDTNNIGVCLLCINYRYIIKNYYTTTLHRYVHIFGGVFNTNDWNIKRVALYITRKYPPPHLVTARIIRIFTG